MEEEEEGGCSGWCDMRPRKRIWIGIYAITSIDSVRSHIPGSMG
jgi:hypothetical protein